MSSTAALRCSRLAAASSSQSSRALLLSSSSSAASTAASSPSSRATQARAAFSSSATARAGDSHGSHYDPPTGWLWGVPPEKRAEKEGWESVWYWGFCGGIGLAVVAYAFKPDTSIETWALEEAKRRLQAEGTLPEDDESR